MRCCFSVLIYLCMGRGPSIYKDWQTLYLNPNLFSSKNCPISKERNDVPKSAVKWPPCCTVWSMTMYDVPWRLWLQYLCLLIFVQKCSKNKLNWGRVGRFLNNRWAVPYLIYFCWNYLLKTLVVKHQLAFKAFGPLYQKIFKTWNRSSLREFYGVLIFRSDTPPTSQLLPSVVPRP